MMMLMVYVVMLDGGSAIDDNSFTESQPFVHTCMHGLHSIPLCPMGT